jgi:hypothetical protein
MPDALFKKLFFFTDIHFGRHSNSPVSLDDNLDFLKWAIDEAKTQGCDACIFGGDWHDNRHSLHISTLNASIEGLQLLNDAFPVTYFLPGNHDLYYRDRRDVASTEFARYLPNIKLIRNPTTIGEVTLLPWLVGDEHKKIKTKKSRYTFAHLEMPGFMMNAKVEMPDSPHAVQADSFADQDLVFTGHFHMRQVKGNVVYTGNVMPFTFSDNWDDERGMMILEWGKDPQFHAWPGQPLFRTMRLSEMIVDPARYLTRNLTARITLDVDISYDEAQALRDDFVKNFGLRKMELAHQVAQTEEQDFVGDVVFQTVDQIVIDGLMSVSRKGFDPDRLVDIYKGLPNG